jgi:hypothetical protein
MRKLHTMKPREVQLEMGKHCERVLARLVRAQREGSIDTLEGIDGAAYAALFVVSMMRQRYQGLPKDISAELDEALAIFASLTRSFRANADAAPPQPS